MPQKPVIKGKKIEKTKAANKHGKGDRLNSRKGKLDKPPKTARLLKDYKESQEITKMINANNESNLASKAENAGGKLKALKAPPPVLAPKSSKAQQSTKAKGDTEMDQD